MDPSPIFIFFFLAFGLVCLKLILSLRNSKTISNLQRPLPPGSTGFPIVGETMKFSTMGKEGTPERFLLDRMNKYSHQVFKTSLLGAKTAVCCGALGNKFLFSNQNELIAFSWPSSARKIFPHSGTATRTINENSMRFRGIFLGFFNPDALRNCVETIDIVAKEHLNSHWDSQKEVHVLSMVKLFAFTAACRLFLNMDNPNQIKELSEPFEALVAGIFSLPLNFPGSCCYHGIRASNAIRKKLLGIIKEKKNYLRSMDERSVGHDQDYVSHLLTVTDDSGRMSTEQEVADQILASLAGSRDSTASAVTFITKYLAEFPHIYDQVLEAILESSHNAQKPREYFPEPEKFDPSRFDRTRPIPYVYVPFGGGARGCPGKDIARLAVLIFVYNVVGKFRWEKLIPDEKIVVSPVPVPAKGLPVRLFPN